MDHVAKCMLPISRTNSPRSRAHLLPMGSGRACADPRTWHSVASGSAHEMLCARECGGPGVPERRVEYPGLSEGPGSLDGLGGDAAQGSSGVLGVAG